MSAFSRLSRSEEHAGFVRLDKLGVNEEDWRRMTTDDSLAQQVASQFIASRKPVDLLKRVGSVNIAATEGRFTAESCFRVNKEANGLPQISYIWPDFQNWFMAKVEEPIQASVLGYCQLVEQSRDDRILAALGGEEKAETTLTEIFQLMVGQKTGQSGPLLTNSWANIFYVKDVQGVLRAVFVYWDDDGWRVGAYTVDDPNPWYDGYRVFSRNSGNSSIA